MKVKKRTLQDVINYFPSIEKINIQNELKDNEYDFYLGALGFEDRSLSIPKLLSNSVNFSCSKVIYFKYKTNIEANSFNEPNLLNCFEKFSSSIEYIDCDEDNFTKILNDKIDNKPDLKIIFDVSVCSSRLIINVLKILLGKKIKLTILYTEAETYYPLYEEYEKNPDRFKDELELGIAKGVQKVITSPMYPGGIKENPSLIVAFPTFKPERTLAIVTDIDESILLKPDKRLIWILGSPNMEEPHKENRLRMLKEINDVGDSTAFNVSTLYYKQTIEVLEQIYQKYNIFYHINISDVGSKMQSIGISIFCYFRPDVSIYFAIPQEYNSNEYSKGIKDHWQIKIESMSEFVNKLNEIDSINIENGSSL